MSENQNNEELDLNQLMKIRREKLEKLQKEGKDPFAITKYKKTHTSKQIIDHYDELEGQEVTVAGRMIKRPILVNRLLTIMTN